MSGKYYTPEITEFCEGFEYEIFEDFDFYPEKTWHKFYFTYKDVEKMNFPLPVDTKVRVKYLDKNDIKSIGFKCTGGAMVEGGKSYFEKGVYGITLRPNYYKNGSPDVHIYKYRPVGVTIDTRFSGDVKNKSEIKKLLRQLNIETDEK